MAKRFTDTDKWKKPWFRKLTPELKVFWQYLIDNCDNAGIWEVDFELASIFIGVDLNPEKIIKEFEKQIEIFDNGKRWFILDFIEFQYNCTVETLNPQNNAHKSVISILEKWKSRGLQGATQGLISPSIGAQDKDKDKDKDKDLKEGVAGETTEDGLSEHGGPSLKEVTEHFAVFNYSQEEARAFWDYYESIGWVNSRGQPILSWKPKVDAWVRNSIQFKQDKEAKEKEKQNGTAKQQSTYNKRIEHQYDPDKSKQRLEYLKQIEQKRH